MIGIARFDPMCDAIVPIMKTCPHLEALEIELATQGVALGAGGESPYGPDFGTWFQSPCTFDEPSLRERLKLDDSVQFTEYDVRVAGSDATFYCEKCKRAITGMHPRYAPAGTKHVR